MKTKLAIVIVVVAFSLIGSLLSAQTISECELGIQLVQDIIADPVIASTTDSANLAEASNLLSTAVTNCDGTESGRVAALDLLAQAAALLGHPGVI